MKFIVAVTAIVLIGLSVVQIQSSARDWNHRCFYCRSEKLCLVSHGDPMRVFQCRTCGKEFKNVDDLPFSWKDAARDYFIPIEICYAGNPRFATKPQSPAEESSTDDPEYGCPPDPAASALSAETAD